MQQKSPCTWHVRRTQSVFACSRGRVQAVSASWALSAHECIDFKVISVIRVTSRVALHTMKSYFKRVWYSRGRILAEVIFMFSIGRLLLVSLYSVWSSLHCIVFHVKKTLCEKCFRYRDLLKYLHLFVLRSVHLIMWWHFKVLVEGSALTYQICWTVMTFAADKC